MEFYLEKITKGSIESKLPVEEAIDKLSQHVASPPEWYKFRSPFWGGDKPYEGRISGNSFSILKKDYLSLKGTIECKGNGSVVSIEMQDITGSSRDPSGWAGKKTTAALGMVVYPLGLVVLLTTIFQLTSTIVIGTAALMIPIVGYTIWKTNKLCIHKFMTKADDEAEFLSRILDGKRVESSEQSHLTDENNRNLKLNISEALMNSLGLGLPTTIAVYLFSSLTGCGRWLWKSSINLGFFGLFVAISVVYLLITLVLRTKKKKSLAAQITKH